MKNKLLEAELSRFFRGELAFVNSSTGAPGGIGQISAALRILDLLQRRCSVYELLPEGCLNEPEVVKAAAEKLYDGIKRAKELLAILEKHYGEVKEKPRGGGLTCGPCVCESAAPCSPGDHADARD